MRDDPKKHCVFKRCNTKVKLKKKYLPQGDTGGDGGGAGGGGGGGAGGAGSGGSVASNRGEAKANNCCKKKYVKTLLYSILKIYIYLPFLN